MLELNGLSVRITRGDTAALAVTLTGDVPPNGSRAIVTLKRAVGTAAIWEKRLSVQDGVVSITLAHEDTNITPGEYRWDMRLIMYAANGLPAEIITPFTPQPWRVLEVVGDVPPNA